jgi:hypothetical protein
MAFEFVELDRPADGTIIGINRRSYPAQPFGRYVQIIVVLVAGQIGDYAAYIAAGASPEWTARYGNKLCFEEANVHFCGSLEREKYRE